MVMACPARWQVPFPAKSREFLEQVALAGVRVERYQEGRIRSFPSGAVQSRRHFYLENRVPNWSGAPAL
jgi:hypothetical protein